MRRFLLDAQSAPTGIKFNHTIPFGIPDIVSKNHRPLFQGRSARQGAAHAVAIKNIVTEDQCNALLCDELTADDEGLRDPLRLRLFGKLESHSPLRSVLQEIPKARQ